MKFAFFTENIEDTAKLCNLIPFTSLLKQSESGSLIIAANYAHQSMVTHLSRGSSLKHCCQISDATARDIR